MFFSATVTFGIYLGTITSIAASIDHSKCDEHSSIEEEPLWEHGYQVVAPGIELPEVVAEADQVECKEQPVEADKRSEADQHNQR